MADPTGRRMTNRGPQFDEFHRLPRDPHGPEHDEFGTPSGPARAHGAQHDEFAAGPTAGTMHGPQGDSFDWKPMPAMHGQQFDSDFDRPAALDGGEHGTWHDVFRGAEVRYIAEGRDFEGVVLNTGRDHAIVEPVSGGPNGGGRHEIGLGQVKELRRMTQLGGPAEDRHPVAKPGRTRDSAPASTAHAPSAHDHTARGGGRTEGALPGTQDGVFANKSLTDTVDELRKRAADAA